MPGGAYFCSLGGHDDTAIVLTGLELFHVLIQDADFLLIVPARWTEGGGDVCRGVRVRVWDYKLY